jgi:hypothetical protein
VVTPISRTLKNVVGSLIRLTISQTMSSATKPRPTMERAAGR